MNDTANTEAAAAVTPAPATTAKPVTGLAELSPEELVARYNGHISARTFANWRSQGKGPKYIRRGGKIFYPIRLLDEWDEQNTYQSTANYKPE